MLHFIWVFTVCKCTHLGVSRILRVNILVSLQDVCKSCGSYGRGDEGRLIVCTQCGQCYHPYCASIKVSSEKIIIFLDDINNNSYPTTILFKLKMLSAAIRRNLIWVHIVCNNIGRWVIRGGGDILTIYRPSNCP